MQEQEHLGGGRFNRLIGVVFVAVAMVGGVALALGVQSSGKQSKFRFSEIGGRPRLSSPRTGRNRGPRSAWRGAPRGTDGRADTSPADLPGAGSDRSAPKPPSRYAQWAEEKYMKALESPEMVQAFHSGGTLEIASAKASRPNCILPAIQNNPTISVHPAASPYTVMAGSVIPAVLISGINSDLPGPILAQVSQNVFDSATGRSVLIPQGSRLIGVYQNASTYGQQRVQIAWQRLIFPNTSSMDLPQMPGADQSGYAGFSDQVNNHYLATFGTAALMSLISAGQMVGQMAAFGGGGTYGPYGYYQPNQWAMASQTAGFSRVGTVRCCWVSR